MAVMAADLRKIKPELDRGGEKGKRERERWNAPGLGGALCVDG